MGGAARDHFGGDQTVGMRDLSHRTSRVLARVRAGERLVVTDRGEPIAVVIPLRRAEMGMPAGGYAPSGAPQRPPSATEELRGFGE